MFRIFTIDPDSDLPVLSLEVKLIECFKQVIVRDRGSIGDAQGRKKQQALKELAFVYWAGVINSKYLKDIKEDSDRKEDKDKLAKAYKQIIQDVGLADTWKPDSLILQCLEWWKDAQKTELTETLAAIKGSLNSLREYIRDIDLKETVKEGSRKGELLHNPKNILEITNKLRGSFQEYLEMEKLVIAEMAENSNVAYGGRTIGIGERGNLNEGMDTDGDLD